jgi:uncharacterized protein (TIGR02246 family)
MRTMVGLVLGSICLFGAPLRASAGARSDVATMLAQSASAWNRGDLDAFMQSYEDSPQTVYMSATNVLHGYAAIRAHYAADYHPGAMGTLSVSDLTVRQLGADYAVATARWHLVRPHGAGNRLGGLFSLVLHRTPAGWKIIADHTP